MAAQMMTIQLTSHTYDRCWDEIQNEYLEAIDRRDEWKVALDKLNRLHGKRAILMPEFREAVRNYNALRGVVKTLKWVLDSNAEHPLD
tara:strand:+ start:14737 stop:15000 length:264 start_codon:yes stop_codon:yes gene_type:complete